MYGIPDESINNYLVQFDWQIQGDILQEECAELIQAISKFKRNTNDEALGKTKEEMSHVLTSCAIFSRIHGISEEDILIEITKKDKSYQTNSSIAINKKRRILL